MSLGISSNHSSTNHIHNGFDAQDGSFDQIENETPEPPPPIDDERPPPIATMVPEVDLTAAESSSSPYEPFEVAPGLTVNGRIGIHWDATTSTPYPDARVDQAILRAQELGAGYAVV